ncbi:MAG: ammonium transporter [Leptolyngbyaceae cyanobacterium MO_188.B28]|nr:ammonium transporter [Leptolyngbyaceae cyanobacterium MO_188.B28]
MTHNAIDLLWLVSCSGLVFLMQAGFLCLEAGATRRKNNINIVIKNIADLGLSVLIFWAVGHGVMFGQSYGGWLGGNDYLPALEQKTAWFTAFFLFQAIFCSTSVTILSGAVAERMSFRGYIAISAVVSGLIYPFFGHWAWNGLGQGQSLGWLGERGFIDFAGSTVVHSLGGWSALATVLFIGPRLGRFSRKRSHQIISGSDFPFSFLGALLLWFGWFGFNGGSALAFDGAVPIIITHTLIAGAAGLITPIIIALARQQSLSVNATMNGALAGLVAITANCNAVSTGQSILIGAVGSLIMLWLTALLERLRIDDAVGAIPVHLGAGVWGTLAVALFANPDILNTGLSRIEQLKVQVAGIMACGLWSFTATMAALLIFNRFFRLRVTPRQEYVGLNVTEHLAKSTLLDFYTTISYHARTGNLKRRISLDSFSEAGQLSHWYHKVVSTLEQAVEKTEVIFKTAGEGILLVSIDQLRIQNTNPQVERILDLPKANLIGSDFAKFVCLNARRGGQARPSLKSTLKLASQTQQPCEILGRRGNGCLFPCEMTVTETRVFKDAFYTVMIRDITERKMAETNLRLSAQRERDKADQLSEALRQLKLTQAQLIHTEKMVGLGHLVAGVAHEINNPVNFIYGNLKHAAAYVQDLLHLISVYRRQYPTNSKSQEASIDDREIDFLLEDFPKLIASMQTGTVRIRDIIQSLRNFSHYDESELKSVDIHADLESTLHMLAYRLDSTAQPITLVRRYGDIPKVKCYASAMNQVFLSILSNAIDALEAADIDQPKIVIATRATAQTLIISITNNGPSIPPELQSQIFDPFFTTKLVGQGPGLGLTTAHSIVVNQHQGRLYIQPGKGVTFVIEIPLTLTPSKQTSLSTASSS